MKIYLFFVLFFTTSLFAKEIKVFKSDRRLQILADDQSVIKEYKVVLGQTPIGEKSRSGDNKTPEGEYILDYKNSKSLYHLAFHISYPNKAQIKKAKEEGYNPGGDIMLHGYPTKLSTIAEWLTKMEFENESEEKVRSLMPLYDWTNGCIAVTNTEIEEIDSLIQIPIKITIYP